MIYVALFFNVALMIAMPLVLAWRIVAVRKPGWDLFGIGAATFVISQVGHIPFNWLLIQRLELIPTDVSIQSNLIIMALFAGISAGMFEEVARYLTYKHWAKKARTWGKGLMLGAGHGGIEAIILGVIVGINYVALSRMRAGALLSLIPEGQWPLVQAQIEALFSAPWYLILLGAAERLFALCFHLAASLMVMQVFVRGQFRWLIASILWHTLLNSAAVFAAVTWNAYVPEAIIAALAMLSLGIVFWLRAPEPVEPEQEPLPEPGPAKPVEIELSDEMLEKSRYH
jgi:uncharacterized membrane protein YhfC